MSFGGPRMAMRAPGGAPAERAKDLRGTLRRLLARLRPERLPLAAALMLGVTSVAFMVTGPRILGNATNVLFNGVVGKLLPAGTTKAQAIATLRAHGQAQIASMVSGMNVTPGKGVDLGELGRALGLAALVYLLGPPSTSARDTRWRASPSARCSGSAARSRRSSAGCRCA
jgi:hypothetical protein